MYLLNYRDEIIEKRTKTIPLTDLDRAKELLKEMKDVFIEECDFMDCVEVEKDTHSH